MFTEQDLNTVKKIRTTFYEKNQQIAHSSSVFSLKTEDELYFERFILNTNFKIVHLCIENFQFVGLSNGRSDSYVVYVIRVMTEDYSYEIRRRYSQFLVLYQTICNLEGSKSNTQNFPNFSELNSKTNRIQYVFPVKKLSSSLLDFLNLANKQKTAEQRKLTLNNFLNQININFVKHPSKYTSHFIELLKFIDLKDQNMKFWKQKQAHLTQLSNIALKDQIKTVPKANIKQTQNTNVSIQHLSELLQHQINKINLSVALKSGSTYSCSSLKDIQDSDPLSTDEIIKNVDCIRDIVLQMKRRINYDHIRCIMKGKELIQKNQKPACNALSPFNPPTAKKGLIQYALKHANNQLVIMHILKIIQNFFLNSECNYSSDAFMKVLAELEPTNFSLSKQNEHLALNNAELRQQYFKLIKKYIEVKEIHGSEKKQVDNFIMGKYMDLVLINLYEVWEAKFQKNKQFRLKDEQKQWVLVIENVPQKFIVENGVSLEQKDIAKTVSQTSQSLSAKMVKKYKSQFIKMNLKISKQQNCSTYLLRAAVSSTDFKGCIELMKNQKNWNPFLVDSQLDIYTNTRKQLMKIPGKQQKMFRFVEEEHIQINIEAEDENKHDELDDYIDFISAEDEEIEQNQSPKEVNPKSSVQTMPSQSGSCAHEHPPSNYLGDHQAELVQNSQWQKIVFVKSPPKEGSFNTYSQNVRVQKMPVLKNKLNSCLVEIQMDFVQSNSLKYFMSEVQGETEYLWNKIKNIFDKANPTGAF